MNQFFGTLWLALSGFVVVRAESNICRVTCDVDFETIGCYKDTPQRALPHYIYNERDPSINNYGGRRIDWFNWNEYFPGFACRCAKKAKELGYDLFGLQFYGECWAGNSNQHDYAQHGEDNDEGCIGDDYQPCDLENARYCVGHQWRNMVYRIVDTSCPQAPFEKVECFNDRKKRRSLPDYLLNDRDVTIPNFSGQRIDWRNWDVYLPKFACRCAEAAKNHSAAFFGVQFYGECWSSQTGHLSYNRYGLSTTRCVDQCYKPCKKYNKFCSGTRWGNFVYKLKDAPCEIGITPIGCYQEDPSNLAMKDIFYNEAIPGKPNFGGILLQESTNYTADFPKFLCKCARYARENGWQYFGVRELGLCVRSTPIITDFDKYGPSDQCFEGKASAPCPSGSRLCGSLSNNANFVYMITSV